MCPVSVMSQLSIIGIVLLAVYTYKRMYDVSRSNIEVLSGLLERPTVKSSYFSKSIEGYYKGRIVRRNYFMYDNNDGFMGPSIEPHYTLQKPKLFTLTYIRPTPNTILRGNKVYYNKIRIPFTHTNWIWNNVRRYTQQEFIEILEELTQAAQKVEKNPTGI